MALRVRRSHVPKLPPSCDVRECMRFLTGTWTPNVLWALRAGPRRFGELQRDLPGVSAKVLTARLRQMQAQGTVSRTPRATTPPSVEYALTDVGAELIPVLDRVVEVGRRLKHRRAACDGGSST